MPQVSSRAIAAPSPKPAALAGPGLALFTLALLVASHPGHAVAADDNPIGTWMSDKSDPATTYSIRRGPSAGTVRILVPAQAFGERGGQAIILEQQGPGAFATAKGAPVRASFKLSDPRHATFQMVAQSDTNTFGVRYTLLEKQ